LGLPQGGICHVSGLRLLQKRYDEHYHCCVYGDRAIEGAAWLEAAVARTPRRSAEAEVRNRLESMKANRTGFQQTWAAPEGTSCRAFALAVEAAEAEAVVAHMARSACGAAAVERKVRTKCSCSPVVLASMAVAMALL
jgi:hypothetical protein